LLSTKTRKQIREWFPCENKDGLKVSRIMGEEEEKRQLIYRCYYTFSFSISRDTRESTRAAPKTLAKF
jgi:hypothetical protein